MMDEDWKGEGAIRNVPKSVGDGARRAAKTRGPAGKFHNIAFGPPEEIAPDWNKRTRGYKGVGTIKR